MKSRDLLLLWSDSPALSVTIWTVIAVVALYLARRPAHAVIVAACRVLGSQSRLAAHALANAATTLGHRTRRALLVQARQRAVRAIDREASALGTAIDRDLAGFPSLQRALRDQIARIDADYHSAADTPPPPPEWLRAVDAIAALPARDDPAVRRILEDMNATLDRACHEAIGSYRAASRRRQRLLGRLRPYWSRMELTLGRQETGLERLRVRAAHLQDRLEHFEAVRLPVNGLVRQLSNGAATRFLASCLTLSLVLAAAVMGFYMLRRPLAEISAELGEVAGIPFDALLAGMTLALTALAGAVLLETGRVTRLFPALSLMDDRPRRLFRLGGVLLLATLIAAAAGLAWTRDYLMATDQAVATLLAEGEARYPSPVFHWIPAVVHSALTVGLSGLVACLLLPLEGLLREGRLLLLGAGVVLLQIGAALLRSSSALVLGTGRLLLALYDLLIFLPLSGERAWLAHRRQRERALRNARGELGPSEQTREAG